MDVRGPTAINEGHSSTGLMSRKKGRKEKTQGAQAAGAGSVGSNMGDTGTESREYGRGETAGRQLERGSIRPTVQKLESDVHRVCGAGAGPGECHRADAGEFRSWHVGAVFERDQSDCGRVQ